MNAKYIIKTVMSGAAAGAFIVFLQNSTTNPKAKVLEKVKEILWSLC